MFQAIHYLCKDTCCQDSENVAGPCKLKTSSIVLALDIIFAITFIIVNKFLYTPPEIHYTILGVSTIHGLLFIGFFLKNFGYGIGG